MFHNKLMHNLIHRIRKLFHSFRARLIIFFLLCSIIPFFIIGAISYHTTYSLAQEKILRSVYVSNTQLVQQINSRFTQMESVADSVNNYIYTLAGKTENSLSEYMDYFSNARSNINTLNNNFNLFQTCVFMSPNSIVSREGLMFYSIDNLMDFKIKPTELSNIGVTNKWLYRSDLVFPVILTPNDRSIDSILCCQSLTKNNELIYALFTSIKSDELSDLLINSFLDTPIISYICTADKQVVAHNIKNQVGSFINTDKFDRFVKNINQDAFTWGDTKYLVQSLDNGFYLITEVPINYITKNIKSVIGTIFTSLLIMVPVIIGITIFISLNLTKKLSRLTKVVRSTNISSNKITAKDFGHHFNINSEYGDEIDKLASSYEDMLSTIDHNLANILELSIMEEKLKYQLLQSQINPHFLYNILGTIQTCLTIGKSDIAHQMIKGLSKFYRITLRKNNDLITIRDELEIATLYLELEHLCRDDSFTWDIECEDGIENFMICKFTLQPFLENCLLHGIERSNQPVHILINLRYGDDTILITIQDDGVGISESYLNNLQHSLNEHIVDYTKNFGISNVNARISSPLYGSGYIQIDSTKGKGTTITIEFEQILDKDY
ncbi:MAG: histidine kinase [Anaerocolumna sp.]